MGNNTKNSKIHIELIDGESIVNAKINNKGDDCLLIVGLMTTLISLGYTKDFFDVMYGHAMELHLKEKEAGENQV